MRFYAGYDFINTDVAVFDSEEKRDVWVENESIFKRISLSEKEAYDIVGKYELCEDEVDDIVWMINDLNIINT